MIKFFRNPVDTPTTANIEVYQEGDVQRVEATEQMQSALRDASTVIAWVEHGPSVLAVGAVADFLEKQGSAEVSVVEYERDIHPANLAELPVEPTPELVRECLELWRAFCSDDPTVYNVLVEDFEFEEPRRACRRLIEAFPDTSRGLSVSEEKALEWIGTSERPPGYRDAYRAVEGLVDLELRRPLVSSTAVESGQMPDSYALTPTGRNVLEGRANHVELNGIDRRIGGVHLSSEDGQLWWRHDGQIVRRPT